MLTSKTKQEGIHGTSGLAQFDQSALRKWSIKCEWLMLGVVLGSMLPDADNLAVVVATLTKSSTQGLHRTFSHSLFMVLAIILIGYLFNQATKQSRWYNLGLGLGLGIFLHSLLDVFLWFDGVAILWPIPVWLNLWSRVTPPDWWATLMQPAELLFFTLFFLSLYSLAQKQVSDQGFLRKLRIWIALEAFLFVIFLVLAFTLSKGFLTIFGAFYLLSLGLAVWVTIRMRSTIERRYERISM
ncbi:MAG TPA: metal-dependent hydrolase [Anaerolineales bacterium]